MQRFERSCEVGVPANTAYAQWLHFDKEKGWGGEITERVDGQTIAWRSDRDEGRVRFEPLPGERTRVRVAMQCETADEAVPQRMQKTLEDFTRFVQQVGKGLSGAAAAGNPGSLGAAPGGAGGTQMGGTGGTPGAGGGKPGATP